MTLVEEGRLWDLWVDRGGRIFTRGLNAVLQMNSNARVLISINGGPQCCYSPCSQDAVAVHILSQTTFQNPADSDRGPQTSRWPLQTSEREKMYGNSFLLEIACSFHIDRSRILRAIILFSSLSIVFLLSWIFCLLCAVLGVSICFMTNSVILIFSSQVYSPDIGRQRKTARGSLW